MRQCPFCLRMLSSSKTLYKHKKNCVYKTSPIIRVKEQPEDPKYNALMNKIIELTDKIDNLAQKPREVHNHIKRVDKIEHIDKQVNQKIDKQVNQQINHQQINQVVITKELPKCFYQALIDKMGKTDAVNLINSSTASNSGINIYKELYPSKKVADNPVIYDEETFKYLEDNKIMADNKIIVRIAREIQKAMLYASSDLITESVRINMTDQLYDIYDIGRIQDNVQKVNIIKKQVSNYIKLELILD